MGKGTEPAAVADGWYSLLPGVLAAQRAFRALPGLRRLPRRVVDGLATWPPTRGVLLFLASVRAPVIGVTREDPGWAMVLALRALFGRHRKLVVFQFIVHPRRHPLRRLLFAWDRWAIRRAMLRGHALTRTDQHALAERYDRPIGDFPFVPWPLAMEAPDDLPPAPGEPLVLSAGRAYCDWPTLFAAARGSGWPLTVVCHRRDRAEVDRLNRESGGAARVLSDLPADEFAALLARATVSVICMTEAGTSQGHIRVMDAAAAGVPIVASATSSLDGYVTAGVTGLLVAIGDAGALRSAVDGLLADEDGRERLRTAAWNRAAGWQVEHYFAALDDLVRGDEPRLTPAAPDADGYQAGAVAA
jgi:glycosyltransferase involved in cell wall biosynthesis